MIKLLDISKIFERKNIFDLEMINWNLDKIENLFNQSIY